MAKHEILVDLLDRRLYLIEDGKVCSLWADARTLNVELLGLRRRTSSDHITYVVKIVALYGDSDVPQQPLPHPTTAGFVPELGECHPR
ncbi:hypothetical protein [Alicyclobacillus sendaiensis]|uniref:hypothetical protein n=1 Tax=Alicyclobacillus sendaiensis TaxID=192387 RepID=UPI0026F45E9E|nr:hypothetical protein [Alicyclobacillus sendaiensis]